MHTHVYIKLHDHFNCYLFWGEGEGMRHILTAGKYKLDHCTIITTCTKKSQEKSALGLKVAMSSVAYPVIQGAACSVSSDKMS